MRTKLPVEKFLADTSNEPVGLMLPGEASITVENILVDPSVPRVAMETRRDAFNSRAVVKAIKIASHDRIHARYTSLNSLLEAGADPQDDIWWRFGRHGDGDGAIVYARSTRVSTVVGELAASEHIIVMPAEEAGNHNGVLHRIIHDSGSSQEYVMPPGKIDELTEQMRELFYTYGVLDDGQSDSVAGEMWVD